MSMQRYLAVAATGGLVAAASLALATTLEAPGFYVPALLAILAIFVAREGWLNLLIVGAVVFAVARSRARC